MNTTQRLRDLSKVELRAVRVAFYLAQGMSEGEIAALLFPQDSPKTAFPRVANAKKLALRRGWLTRPLFSEKSFPGEDNLTLQEEAHYQRWIDLEKKLQEQSGGILKTLRVCYSGYKAEPKGKEEWDEALDLFAHNAAPYVLAHLCKSRLGIAVGWGMTVACASEAAGQRLDEATRPKQNGQRAIRIVPTACEPLQPPAGRDTSSTNIATVLNGYLNGPRNGRVWSLKNIPSVLPETYTDKAKRKDIEQDFLKFARDYWEIFGDQEDPDNKSLIAQCDTSISSGGAFHQWQIFADALFKSSGISPEELQKLAVGDIGGILIPRLGITEKEKTRFEQIKNLWTGIRLEQYQRIARSAAQSTEPDAPAGSMLIAIGKSKAEIILDLVTRADLRVVNALVIDAHLAQAISDLLDEQNQLPRPPQPKR
jgi:DNA-binding transcriptional regulator LsrR (DeoR family)